MHFIRVSLQSSWVLLSAKCGQRLPYPLYNCCLKLLVNFVCRRIKTCVL